jgi:dienelactone hydrolase
VLQRVSFPVAGVDLAGVLHIPEAGRVGAAAVLHGFGGGPDQPHIVATCEALAAGGVGALRFAFRGHRPPTMTLQSALADTAGALRLLKAHPELRGALAVVGFSFGGAVAALAAGRDSRVKAAVLAAAPAAFTRTPEDQRWKPIAELSRSRARVLLIWGSRDTEVPFEDTERYRAVLTQARVSTRVVTIEGGDHDFAPAGPRAEMARTIADWVADSLSA